MTEDSIGKLLQENYETQIGDVKVLNLGQSPQYKKSLGALMTVIRDKNTRTRDFRNMVKEIYSSYILPHFLETLPFRWEDITTGNNARYTGIKFYPRDIWAVDIPRAGTLPTEEFIDKMGYTLQLCSSNFVIQKAVIDVKRMEKKGGKLDHVIKDIILPEDKYKPCSIVILDPMLATGGSCYVAISELKKHAHISHIFTGHIVGAPEGIIKIADLLNYFSIESKIVLAAVDSKLDEKKYIVPGLGDAGDRLCF